MFDIKGTVKTALSFNNLKLYSSSFGVDASTTTSNVFVKLSGSSTTLTSMKNWDIQGSTFDQGFTLVDYP